ncbi:MAG: amino acid permease [Chloroflexi bacterium]|nr:amino acid permease [Chloroflexota bacterium]MBI3339019.1 amino acid permease [Chloroflexota bacterium]
MLSVVLLLVILFLAYKVAPRENKEHTHKHGAGQIALLAALALFGVDYFTSFYYAAGEMLSALHPYGLQQYAYITAGVIAFTNIVFGGLYMYSLGPFNEGGGSYTASMRYLTPTLSLIVAITLIEDYVLTIVVSALSGGDQLLSILNAYGAPWIWHFALGAALAAVTWYLTIRGRGESAKTVFTLLATFVLLTIIMAIGLFIAKMKGVPPVPLEAAPQAVSFGQAILHMLTASMKGMVALTGLEAVSNGVQFMIEEDTGIVKWGKQHMPRLNKLWDFYSGRSGIARFVQTSFLFYGGITTFFLTYFAIYFDTYDGTLGRTLVANLAFIGFTQIPGGEILYWAYQILAVAMLAAASMTAFQDAQATEWRDVAIGEIPEAIIKRDVRGTFTRSVTITFGLSIVIMLLVRGNTSVAIPFYGVGVFLPIMIMGLAVRRHVLEHFTGRMRTIGAAASMFAAVLAGVVFVGQIVGKWEEGGWVRLLTFATLFLSAHLVLLSPAGYRGAKQVSRIVHEKARVEGGMASIVKWQAFKMQEYRYRLMIGLTSLLELFGVGQMSRRTVAALAGGGSVRMSQFISSTMNQPVTSSRSKAISNHKATENKTVLNRKFDHYHLPPRIVRHRIIVPVNGVHQGALTALRYAHSLSSDVTALHIAMDKTESETLQRQWATWGEGVRLVVLESPHKMVLEPLLEYIQKIMAIKQEDEIITVVVPQSIEPRWWSNLARTQLAGLLRLALPFETGIVITDVPYAIENDDE